MPLAAHGAAAQPQTQVSGSLDLGGASVVYDEFERTTVGTLSPMVRIERGRALVVARGAVSRFQSGNQSIDGAVAASYVSPAFWKIRGEVFATAASTHYSEIGNAATNLFGVGRAHLADDRRGVWIGAGLGAVTRGGAYPDDLLQLDGGAWIRSGNATLIVQATPTHVGDVHYADYVATGRVDTRRTQLSATAGYRDGDRAAGASQWAELGAAYWVGRHLAIVGGGGVFPAEVWRGLPGGKYVSAALRVATQGPHESDPQRLAELTHPYELNRLRRPRAVAQQFIVDIQPNGTRSIRIRIPRASNVELMADFTDWLPVVLDSVASDTWELNIVVAPGVHRVNIRTNGGRWMAPPGLTVARDEFGGVVGLLVVQ